MGWVGWGEVECLTPLSAWGGLGNLYRVSAGVPRHPQAKGRPAGGSPGPGGPLGTPWIFSCEQTMGPGCKDET